MTRKAVLFALASVVIALSFAGVSALAVDSAIARADELYALRAKQAGAVDQGIALLNEFLASHPDNYDALWRQARFYWYKGDHQPEKKKLKDFEQGKVYAERAVNANEKDPDGHYWYASLIGCVGQEKGILNSLFMVKPMKQQLDRCIELDPNYHDAYDVLAQLYWKVPGPPVSIGNKKKAAELARKAAEMAKVEPGHWVLLGEIQISLKDYAGARQSLNIAIGLPDSEEDPQETKKDKAKAQNLLKEIENK